MVDVVEVFSDASLGALALDVRSGRSGGGVAGSPPAQNGPSSAGDSRSPEERHSRADVLRIKHENRETESGV